MPDQKLGPWLPRNCLFSALRYILSANMIYSPLFHHPVLLHYYSVTSEYTCYNVIFHCILLLNWFLWTSLHFVTSINTFAMHSVSSCLYVYQVVYLSNRLSLSTTHQVGFFLRTTLTQSPCIKPLTIILFHHSVTSDISLFHHFVTSNLSWRFI